VVGGVLAYLHKKRGGEFTLASIKESAQKMVRSLGIDKLIGENAEQRSRGGEVGAHGSSARRGAMRTETGGPGGMSH
jgi:hypothetical protein